MKIDKDARVHDQQESIRKIQEYQLQQEAQQRAAVEQQQRQQIEQSSDVGGAGQDASQLDTQNQQIDEASRERQAQDVQAQIQNQEVAQVNESREASGAERSDEAVDVANVQQDRGEAWQTFAADQAQDAIPPSVEEQAAQDRADAQQQEQQQINMRDLINQMAIQSGKINA